MPDNFNNRLRQIILLLTIFLLAILLLGQLYIFLPGFLGAITFYILLREWYFNLTIKRKWNRTITALLFIIVSLVVIALPVYFSFRLLSEKLSAVLSDPVELMKDARIVSDNIQDMTGIKVLTDENILVLQKKTAAIIPGLLNSSANLLTNFAIMFFLLYFMLKSGRQMEKFMFDRLADAAIEAGIRRVVGVYRPTQKNVLVKELFDQMGFTRIGESAEEVRYMWNVPAFHTPTATHVRDIGARVEAAVHP